MMLRAICTCVVLLAAIASSDPQDGITIHIAGPVEVIVSNTVSTAEKCSGEDGFCVETGGSCNGTIKMLCYDNNDHCTCCVPFKSGGRFESRFTEYGNRGHMQLKIKNVQESDYGTYSCIAQNSEGKTSGTVKLYVVSQVEILIKKKLSTLLNNIVSQRHDTTGWMVFQEKFSELKSLSPVEYSLFEDVYTKVISPTSIDIVTIVNKLPAANDPAFQRNWAVAMNDVPRRFIKLRHRVLDTQIAQNLWSNLLYTSEGPFNKLVLPTFNDIIALIQTVASLHVEFQEYWRTLKAEVPVLVSKFFRRFPDAPILKELMDHPYVNSLLDYLLSENFYNKVIRPTYEELYAVVQKHTYISSLGYQESIQQSWNVIKEEIPTHLNNFKKRLPITKFLRKLQSIEDRFAPPLKNDLRNLRRQVARGAKEIYQRYVLSTLNDVVELLDKLIAVPVSGIEEAIPSYWDILEVELPPLLRKIIQRIPVTQYMDSSFIQNWLTKLETQYPVVYSVARQLFIHFVVIPINDGSFNLHDKSYKIFRVLSLSWDEAKAKCESEGLIMATEPSHALELRKYLLDKYDDFSSVWLSARGNGSHFIWEQQQPSVLMNDDPLRHPSMDSGATTSDRCLMLGVLKHAYAVYPNKAYYEWFCSSNSDGGTYTLCEVSM